MDNTRKIVLFDGSCSFCSHWVKIIKKHDKLNKFTCVPFQSVRPPLLSGFRNLEALARDTVVFVQNDRVFFRSEAAIRILANLGGLYRLSLALLIIPAGIRDYFYTLVARNRHKWFGKESECIN